MNILIVVALSYTLTGVAFIARDLRMPFHNRPAYARDFPRRGVLLPLFGWLPFSIMAMVKWRMWKDGFSILFCFAFLTAGGLLLL